MNFLTLLLTLLISGAVMAGDSGLYYDPDYDGEGISLQRNDNTIVVFLYTYGGEDAEIPVEVPPFLSPQYPLEEPLNGQRWFLTSNCELQNEETCTGVMYGTGGINYPVPLEPNGIGAPVVVGEFELLRVGEGWYLVVDRVEESPLAEDDPLFERLYTFTVPLFYSED